MDGEGKLAVGGLQHLSRRRISFAFWGVSFSIQFVPGNQEPLLPVPVGVYLDELSEHVFLFPLGLVVVLPRALYSFLLRHGCHARGYGHNDYRESKAEDHSAHRRRSKPL